MNSYIVDEINAYVAIRDIALAEARRSKFLNFERARIANDFVENCLKPARSPYESQHLPETRRSARARALSGRKGSPLPSPQEAGRGFPRARPRGVSRERVAATLRLALISPYQGFRPRSAAA